MLVGTPTVSAAHGIWAHIHVTGWAIENLPPGELRDLFSEPEVFNAALFGAAFADSGYWPQAGELQQRARVYGEHNHWEPFIEDFVRWIRQNDPPPWTSRESRQRVAFMMGCAAHGLQDEIFDSLMLAQVATHDGGGQDNADPASDGFLVMDGHLRMVPEPWLPLETLLVLYRDLPQPIDEETIRDAVDLMVTIYVNDDRGPAVARAQGDYHLPALPWFRQHYLDPEIPGSLHSEILPTARYLQALWERLHGDGDLVSALTSTFPSPPRRLLGVDSATADSWVTLIYGTGVAAGSAQASWARESDGADVAATLRGTRWGADWTRLHRLQPAEALTPGAWYSVTLGAGLETIAGRVVATDFTVRFQAPCASDDDPRCPDLGPIEVASIDGPPFPAVQPQPEPGPEPVVESSPEPETEPEAESSPEPEPEPEVEAESAPEPEPSSSSGCASGGPGAWLLVVAFAAIALTRLVRRSVTHS